MASSVRAALLPFTLLARSTDSAPNPLSPSSLSLQRRFPCVKPLGVSVPVCGRRLRKFMPLPFAAARETTEAEETAEDAAAAAAAEQEESETEAPTESTPETETEEDPNSAMISTLNAYKEALLTTKDENQIKEIETYLMSIEEDRVSLSAQVETLTAELKVEHDRLLRISADFDNFRKRTQNEKLNLMDNVKGEVIEGLLPVLDNFERAKVQIKVETEGEKKINDSYQNIYKQFVEILTSLGVKDVETVGTAFDPMFHEAIMREESTEYEEGIILQEFRKGFRLGERLLRPAMVKVSAGPGPAKSDDTDPTEIEDGVLPQERNDFDDDGDDGDTD